MAEQDQSDRFEVTCPLCRGVLTVDRATGVVLHAASAKGERRDFESALDEIRAAQEIGIRFHASRGSMSLGESKGGLPPDRVVESEAAILRDTQRLIETYHDARPCAMLRIVVAPCSPFSVKHVGELEERDRGQRRLGLFLDEGAELLPHGLAVAEQEGIHFVDLLPVFVGQDERELWVHPTDFHPNRLAHRLAGEQLAESLGL